MNHPTAQADGVSSLLSRLVESMEAIMPRTSLLELDVRVSVHPAPDILSLRFCPCVYNRDRIHVLQLDY